ncbi:hypothetical protein [Streptomyces sp. CAU 1734]|uniref:hypothetical protein n=1 Tax=Streptomyces sp. CAU 1734 TaxID=3140360 RepID=UPI0032609D44
MKHATYKGRKLKTVKGSDYGYVRYYVNGVDKGRHQGNEESALDYMRRIVDFADEVGVGSGRMTAEWYAPGTFDTCEHGHPKEIGEECPHTWCVEQRQPIASSVDDEEPLPQAVQDAADDEFVVLPNPDKASETIVWRNRDYAGVVLDESAAGMSRGGFAAWSLKAGNRNGHVGFFATLEEAVDAIQAFYPAPADVEPERCVSVRGGAVHTNRPYSGMTDEAWPACRTGGQDSGGTRYMATRGALTCRNCLAQESYRALANA